MSDENDLGAPPPPPPPPPQGPGGPPPPPPPPGAGNRPPVQGAPLPLGGNKPKMSVEARGTPSAADFKTAEKALKAYHETLQGISYAVKDSVKAINEHIKKIQEIESTLQVYQSLPTLKPGDPIPEDQRKSYANKAKFEKDLANKKQELATALKTMTQALEQYQNIPGKIFTLNHKDSAYVFHLTPDTRERITTHINAITTPKDAKNNTFALNIQKAIEDFQKEFGITGVSEQNKIEMDDSLPKKIEKLKTEFNKLNPAPSTPYAPKTPTHKDPEGSPNKNLLNFRTFLQNDVNKEAMDPPFQLFQDEMERLIAFYDEHNNENVSIDFDSFILQQKPLEVRATELRNLEKEIIGKFKFPATGQRIGFTKTDAGKPIRCPAEEIDAFIIQNFDDFAKRSRGDAIAIIDGKTYRYYSKEDKIKLAPKIKNLNDFKNKHQGILDLAKDFPADDPQLQAKLQQFIAILPHMKQDLLDALKNQSRDQTQVLDPAIARFDQKLATANTLLIELTTVAEAIKKKKEEENAKRQAETERQRQEQLAKLREDMKNPNLTPEEHDALIEQYNALKGQTAPAVRVVSTTIPTGTTSSPSPDDDTPPRPAPTPPPQPGTTPQAAPTPAAEPPAVPGTTTTSNPGAPLPPASGSGTPDDSTSDLALPDGNNDVQKQAIDKAIQEVIEKYADKITKNKDLPKRAGFWGKIKLSARQKFEKHYTLKYIDRAETKDAAKLRVSFLEGFFIKNKNQFKKDVVKAAKKAMQDNPVILKEPGAAQNAPTDFKLPTEAHILNALEQQRKAEQQKQREAKKAAKKTAPDPKKKKKKKK